MAEASKSKLKMALLNGALAYKEMERAAIELGIEKKGENIAVAITA